MMNSAWSENGKFLFTTSFISDIILIIEIDW
jgi:hypothetical protein